MNNNERERSLTFVVVRCCSLAFADNYGRSRDPGVSEKRSVPGRDHWENHPGLRIIVVAVSGRRSSQSRGSNQGRQRDCGLPWIQFSRGERLSSETGGGAIQRIRS